MPETFSGELRALFILGMPMALAQLTQFSIYFIDTVMLGRVGREALAAAAMGSAVYFMLWMLGSGFVMAVSPLVSQALGADQSDRRDARKTVRMSIWVIFFMTPLLVVLLLFIKPALNLVKPELAGPSTYYMMALAPGWPFALGIWSLRNFLAAIEKTVVPLIIVSLTVVINAGLNWVLIFGELGFPRLELVGAGIASSISYTLSFFMFVAYCYWDKIAREFHIFENFFKPHWTRLKEIVRLGWPMSITTTFEGMLFNACIFLMAAIGTDEVAAYQVALNAAAMAFMLPYGFSMAGCVRVGLAAGTDNFAAIRRVGLVTIFICVSLIMMFAAFITLAPNWLADIYLSSSDKDTGAVRALVLSFLPIAAAFMLFDGTQVAANQLLRGLKDVTVPMWMTGISYWVIGFPVSWYLGLHTDVGAVGVWYGLLLSLISASILLGGRFYWLAWRRGKGATT
jgi:MATE family multidrug resistance protein